MKLVKMLKKATTSRDLYQKGRLKDRNWHLLGGESGCCANIQVHIHFYFADNMILKRKFDSLSYYSF